MDLLDEDAEKLKEGAKASGKTGTGRKVNQSGLGAFKSLAKYNNLTSKYRTAQSSSGPSPAKGDEIPTVEHGRGTNASSPAPQKTEVSAKSVQSQGNIGAASVASKSVQSPAKVSADSNSGVEGAAVCSSDEVSAKSVQSPAEVSAPGSDRPKSSSNAEASVVSAKSVQTRGKVSAATSSAASETEQLSIDKVSANSVQSPAKVSAELVTTFSSKGEATLHHDAPAAQPKSVQSRGEVSAIDPSSVLKESTLLDAKSVQSPSEVSATNGASDQRSDEPSITDSDLKSVQTQGKVSADFLASSQARVLPEMGTDRTQSNKAGAHSQNESMPGQSIPKSVQSESELSAQTPAPSSSMPSANPGIPSFAKHEAADRSNVVGSADERAMPSDPISATNRSSEIQGLASPVLPVYSPGLGKQDSARPAALLVSDARLEAFGRSGSVGDQFNTDETSTSEVGAKSVQALENAGAKSVQSRAQVSVNSGQIEGEDRALPVQTPGKLGSVVSAKLSAKLVQFDDPLEPLEPVSTLAGAQLTVLNFIFENCLWNNAPVTSPITKQQLVAGTQLCEQTALSAIKRLRKKRILDRHSYKDGKAGWTRYQLAESAYKELLFQRQLGPNSVQTQGEASSKVSSKVSAEDPYSSSKDLNISNTTTIQGSPEPKKCTRFEDLPLDWQAIDISPLADAKLSRSHIFAIHNDSGLTSLEVQESIYHMAFDVKNGRIFRNGVIGAFMGILRVNKQPYISSKFLEIQKREIEEQRRLQQEKQSIDRVHLAEALRQGFESWKGNLQDDEKKKILGEINQADPALVDSTLKAYFKETFGEKVHEQTTEKGLSRVGDLIPRLPIVPTVS